MYIKWKKGEKINLPSKYFSSKELECRCSNTDCIEQQVSIKQLKLMDKARESYGKPLFVNRCFSCAKHNASIGGSKNSNHLRGEAADFRDYTKMVKLHFNEQILTEIDGYREADKDTPTWCHLQCNPPGSKRRIFGR